MYGNQWSNPAPTQQHASNYYENYDARYAPQQHYNYTSRSSPALPGEPTSRKLPPLSASPSGDRWQSGGVGGGVGGGTYGSVPAQMQTYGGAQAPNYPIDYSYHQQSQYGYPTVPQQQQMPMNVYAPERGMPGQVESHGPSPYARTLSAAHDTPTVPSEETSIKKKRKRADAAQLKVLNEVYARTAFPSTEERADLARKLDMSARSVQIWFQNKRQSMRQTSRQSSSNLPSGSHQSFSLPSPHEDPRATVGSYGTTGQNNLSNQTYMRGAADSRGIPSGQTTKRRSEEAEGRKWQGHY